MTGTVCMIFRHSVLFFYYVYVGRKVKIPINNMEQIIYFNTFLFLPSTLVSGKFVCMLYRLTKKPAVNFVCQAEKVCAFLLAS